MHRNNTAGFEDVNVKCDRICENVHSSHIHFFNFEDSLNLLCTSEKHETCRDCCATIPLSVQQISDLYLLPIMFYEPLNVQNQMCELCTFSQIRSQIQKLQKNHSSSPVQCMQDLP